MAKNRKFEDGYKLSVAVTDPAVPSSGDAVRYGLLTGVALTNEGGGGNAAIDTTVDFGPGIWDIPVTGEAGAIAVGDPVYYDDAIHELNNDAVNGYFFGFALEVVNNLARSVINVLHTPSPGAGSLGDGTITADKIANGAVALAKIADAILTGLKVAVIANANVIGGIPVLHRIDVADATGDTDVVLTHKTRIIDAWGLNTGIAAHAANDTWQVKYGANAISDAVAKTATVNAVKRIATINPANAEIAAGGTLRIAAVKDTNAAVTVYVLGIRVA